MKQTILIAIACFIHTIGTAQGDCKLEVKKDNFSNSVEHVNKPVKIADGSNMSEWLKPDIVSKDKDTWLIKLHLFSRDSTIVLLLQHVSTYCDGYYKRISQSNFKFEDGTIIKKEDWPAEIPFHTTTYGNIGGNLYILTKDELQKFATQKIALIRIETLCSDHKIIEKTIKEKLVSQIRDNALCLYNQLYPQ